MILGLSRTLEVHPLLLELNETDESAPMIIEFERTNLLKEPITAHVSFEIDDKPWALMHTLESFKVRESLVSRIAVIIVIVLFHVTYIPYYVD